MYELKPCPFCGSRATIERINEPHQYRVACTQCHIGTVWYSSLKNDSKEFAMEAWNKRIAPL